MDEESDPLAPLLARLARDRADEDAWTVLYERMWGFVLAIVSRSLRGEGTEDVAQQVFIRVARYCPFEKLQTGDAFRAYLWRMSRNECMSWFRRHQPSRAAGEASLESQELAEHPYYEFEWRDLYAWATEGLSVEDQEILRLTDEGFTGDQIAKKLDLSDGNVAVRRHRARVTVRKFLKDNGLAP